MVLHYFGTFVLIPGAGPDYGTLLGGYYKPVDKFNKDLCILFPYENMDKDGTYFWLQSSKTDLMKVASQIMQIGTGKVEPIIVIFDVYQKFKLDCGFPKRCGEMTTEEFRINR